MHLQKLMAILTANGIPEPYPCIADVVQNGICLDRFTTDDPRTNRIEMKWQRKKEFERKAAIDNPPPDPERLPVTKRNKKQFEEAVALIEKYLNEGINKKNIADILNESGYKTMFGKPWSPHLVSVVSGRHGLVVTRRNRQKVAASREQLALYRQQQDEVAAGIIQYYSEGKTISEICLLINDKGYRTVTGCVWKDNNVIRFARKYGMVGKRGK